MADQVLPNGTAVLVLVQDPADSTFDVVGSQRDASIDETNEFLDTSNKDQRERRGDYGRYSSSMSLDSLYVPDDVAQARIKAAARNADKVVLRRSENGTEVEEASAIIASRSVSFPDQGESVISMTFEIDGAWAAV